MTALGYQGGSEGSLALDPIGTQANQGLLQRLARTVIGSLERLGPRWYQLPGGLGPSTSALDVGAPSGTDVYSPVDGSVVAIDAGRAERRAAAARGSTSSRPARRRSSSRSRTSAPTRRSRSDRR